MLALLCALPPTAPAACLDGQKGACVRNGCAGVRECIDGRMQGCEVPDSCLAPPSPPPKDKIFVDQAVPGQEVGVLFDGANTQGPFNDRSVLVTANTTTATAFLPNIRAPAFGNSLVAFSRSRQPRLVSAPWTANADTVFVPLQNNIRFSVTFWILAGAFATQQINAAAAVLAVNNAYTTEKAGVRIAFATVNNATTDPDAAALMNGGSPQQFQAGIGFNPGEINVYVISNANGSPNGGLNFGGTPVILLGQNALLFPQLLEHEIGHAFVLWHADSVPGFNFQNVMMSTVSAHFLTEGQVFRMHFHPSSQLNVLNLRPGQPTIVCVEPGEPATNDCPAYSRRLWQDGNLPPN